MWRGSLTDEEVELISMLRDVDDETRVGLIANIVDAAKFARWCRAKINEMESRKEVNTKGEK